MAVQAIVAPTQAEADALAQKVELWGVELANGQRVTVASEEQAYAFARRAGSEPVRIARRAQSLLAGTAESVVEQLNALHQQWGIDEFIIDTPVAEGLRALRRCDCLPGRVLTRRSPYELWRTTDCPAPRTAPEPGAVRPEVETTARLRQWLTNAGIAPQPYDLSTGLVAEIGTGSG